MSQIEAFVDDGIVVVDSRLITPELDIEWEIFESVIVDLWGVPRRTLSVWDLLAIWQHLTYLGISCPTMSKLIDEVCFFLDERETITVCRLKLAVVTEISLMIQARTSEVGRVHSWFLRNAHLSIDGGTLVEVKTIEGKRPDFLVKKDGVVFPVECKLEFNKTAVKQLQRYMKLWRVTKGYAVAPMLKCELPASIVFIKSP